MARNLSPRACAAGLITAENGQTTDIGTVLANYSPTHSCDLGQPDDSKVRGWGGARNRSDRVSHYLTDDQAQRLMKSAQYAFETGRVFQRHWTVHYGLAGIEPSDGARFVGKLLDLVSKQARREGGRLSAIWVRECASSKGEHVHILMHLPAGMSLKNRTRCWIVAAGGAYRTGVSKVTTVGGRISKLEKIREGLTPKVGDNRRGRVEHNAANVVRYMLKAGTDDAAARLGLQRFGECGPIIGKRCGWSQRLGYASRTVNDKPQQRNVSE